MPFALDHHHVHPLPGTRAASEASARLASTGTLSQYRLLPPPLAFTRLFSSPPAYLFISPSPTPPSAPSTTCSIALGDATPRPRRAQQRGLRQAPFSPSLLRRLHRHPARRAWPSLLFTGPGCTYADMITTVVPSWTHGEHVGTAVQVNHFKK
ncbi:uncharacterized protein SCHCODRAFT_01101843 [Schizophyllum commune H4-8]|nr:uncharacterized protein SCHCODRAFT_01101843 [Schizophyllum commune H4-8]KAI5888419.1 hypothetical protein SCHCODRAFT_01101843 [Schizophyllum commune H4-8]